MENFTIKNHNQYFDCRHRLQYLLDKQLQTEGMKRENELIQAELRKFEKIHSN